MRRWWWKSKTLLDALPGALQVARCAVQEPGQCLQVDPSCPRRCRIGGCGGCTRGDFCPPIPYCARGKFCFHLSWVAPLFKSEALGFSRELRLCPPLRALAQCHPQLLRCPIRLRSQHHIRVPDLLDSLLDSTSVLRLVLPLLGFDGDDGVASSDSRDKCLPKVHFEV